MDSIYKRTGIYGIKNKITDEIYVGFTNMNFGDRKDCHFSLLRQNKHHNENLQRSFNQYKEDSFEFIVIEDIVSDNINVFYEKERYYIKYFSESGKSFNVQTGGPGFSGARLSKQNIAKLSKINKINMTGTKLSKSTTDKMSETRKKNQNRMGGDNHSTILKPNEVYDIKLRLMSGEGCRSLSERYDVTVQCISKINVGANWKKINPPGWEEYLKNRI